MSGLRSAQARLALYRDHFQSAPSTDWYLERARRAAPTDSTIWYASGKVRFDKGDFDTAWADWKQALTISRLSLDAILADVQKQKLSPDALAEKLLPDQPALIYEVAARLYPLDKAPASDRWPLLMKALTLLERSGSDSSAADDYLRGRILHELGRLDDAVAALRQSLRKQPDLGGARLELARTLYDRKSFAEAKTVIDGLRTGDAATDELRRVIEAELKVQ